MGRRSDHSRAELEALILATGRALMDEVGYAQFSAREVAKRIGYSVGTVMNLFGSVDALVMAINTATFPLWTAWLEEALSGVADQGPRARIIALVDGYFSFSARWTNVWAAIYEHRIPADLAMPEAMAATRGALMDLVTREVSEVLPPERQDEAGQLARSLVATVHGHCAFAHSGSFALLGEHDPQGLARARVLEVLAANGAKLT